MEFLNDPKTYEATERLYIAVRGCEGRIYTDEELKQLPDVPQGHTYYDEWQYRKRSAKRLIAYLKKEFGGRQLRILDIGCGNGWLSNAMHQAGYNVTGLDMNVTELTQAERIFGSSSSLRWVYADVFDPAFPVAQYDVIVLAASCQYFPDMQQLTKRLCNLLSPGGEVHLVDSVFYDEKDVAGARQRSVNYYSGLGYPEMSTQYYHHSKALLKLLKYKRLYPGRFNIIRSNSPAWWMLKPR